MTANASVTEIFEFKPRILEHLKHEWLTGETSELQSNLGHFIMWFGTSEMFLTRILAHVLNMPDLAKFDLLCRGMDARVKCERFRKATNAYNPMGPNLKLWLSRFENQSIPIRNKISHSWPIMHDGTIYFCNVKKGAFHPDEYEKDGTEMTSLELFTEGFWLNSLTKHLSDVLMASIEKRPLEISDPVQDQQSEDH